MFLNLILKFSHRFKLRIENGRSRKLGIRKLRMITIQLRLFLILYLFPKKSRRFKLPFKNDGSRNSGSGKIEIRKLRIEMIQLRKCLFLNLILKKSRRSKLNEVKQTFRFRKLGITKLRIRTIQLRKFLFLNSIFKKKLLSI